MKKEDELYKIIEQEGKITSKRVLELGYPRIYLTYLAKQQKIYKVSRGVYSTSLNCDIDPLYEFQKHNHKIIFSNFTALYLQNFYKTDLDKLQISVPQGYNASRYINMEVFYNNSNNYGVGAIYVMHEGHTILVYDIERSICDIIKEQNRFDNRDYNKLINYYFNLDNINYQKLLEYSKILKVSKKVQAYLSLFKA